VGFTLVEVCVAATMLAIAISGLLGVMLAGMSLDRVNRESAIAQQAARAALEQLQGVPFGEVFASYNGWAGDDGGLTLAARGAGFVVAGLDPQPGDADGWCGEVLFPTTLVGAAPQLREDVVDDPWGMPRDLNGDGLVDAADHSNDYRLLPVRVRVRWRGASGDRTLDMETLLCDR
jgi:type II secretory pathway pseudopilin PulG